MKKLIMTAIVICLSIATAIPFYSVNASSNNFYISITDSNNTSNVLGNINGYEIDQNGTAMDTQMFGVVSDYSFKTAFIMDVELNDYYSGRLSFSGTYLNLGSNSFFYLDGEGAYLNVTYNNIIHVDMYNCRSFRLYYFRTDLAVTNRPDTCTLDGTVYNNVFSDYTIPVYQMPAYAFATQNVDQILYSHGDIAPYFNITQGSRSKTVSISASGGVKHFIFISNTNVASGKITSGSNNVSISYSVVPSYTFGGGYRMYDLSFTLLAGAGQSANVWLNYDLNFNMIPIFFGTYEQMPEDVYSLVNNTHIYDSYLSRILAALQAIGDNGQTQDDIDNLADEITDYDSQISDIVSGTSDNIDDFIDAVDLDTYDFLTGIANASEYFKIQLENVFNVSSYIRAFWVIPVICIVLMRLLGG